MNLTPSFSANGNEKQFQAMEAWADPTIERILYGGAKYGGKSYLGGGLITSAALTYPGTHWFIARESLNDLRKFTLPTIYEVLQDMNLNPNDYLIYNGQDNYFDAYNGSKIFFLQAAYAPKDPDYHRFGSIQMTGGWLEEIGEMRPEAIEALLLTIGRWKNKQYNLPAKALLTCNPHKGYGFREFYAKDKNGTLEPNKVFIQALPQDNKMGDKAYIERILNHPIKAVRERLGRGKWEYDDDPATLIDFDTFRNAYHNTHVIPGKRAITADVAFLGSDKFVITVWEGWKIIYIHSMDKSDPKEVETMIKTLAEKYEVPRSRIVYDADGIGSYLQGYLQNAKAFHNGGQVIGKRNYSKLKDQCGFFLAKKFNQGEIWIATEEHREELEEEVAVLKSYKTDDDGKLRILPKKEMKKILNRSPDFLDTLIMRSYLDLNETSITSSLPS